MNQESELLNFLDAVKKKPTEPSEVEFVLYLLAKEFGITRLQDYPLPYLQGLVKTYGYLKELESKKEKEELRKAKSKRR